MNFYFCEDENLCADENWVVGYLCKVYPAFSADDHREGLRNRKLGYFGWHPCNVCNTIHDIMYKAGY